MTVAAKRKPGIGARARGVVLEQLHQGITPHKLALTVAVASCLALFPVLGTTTLLCLGAAAALKLNHPLTQLVNYLLSGVQLLLLVPFWRAGHWIGAPYLSLSLDELRTRFDAAPWQSTRDFGSVMLGGIGVWALAAPLWVALIYLMARPLLVRIAARRQAAANTAGGD